MPTVVQRHGFWRVHVLSALAIASILPTPTRGGPTGIGFAGPTSLAGWTFSNGPEFPGAAGEVEWDATQGRGAPGCLALRFSFEGGGNYVSAGMGVPDLPGAGRVRLWLHKTTAHRVTFRAVDSAGETFQKSTDYRYAGWQQIDVALASWSSHFGGPNDGKVRPPWKQFAILVENTAEPRSGVVLIDDVEMLGEPDDDARDSIATYVAHDFTSGPGWSAAGGAGNRLVEGVWQYQFNDGAPPALRTEFSLLGRPAALRLVLDGDGSGHAVHVEIGSHFQVFHRSIGRLGSVGEQVLEVPLGGMAGWAHHGGQNDGQVRWPLRMLRIGLDRGDGPASGRVRLQRIEVDTRFGQPLDVILVPDVRQEGGMARFSVRIQNLRRTEVPGRLVCDAHTLTERLSRRGLDLTLPAAGQVLEPTFDAPLAGHPMLDAAFHWIGADGWSAPVSIGLSTVPDAPPRAEVDRDHPVGMGVYLYRWSGHPQAHDRMNELADLARRAGVRWIREEFSWERIEPQPGAYRWEFYDDLVGVATEHDLSICGLLAYWAPHADAYTDNGVEQYCAWVRDVVRRYKHTIHDWEVWNEPNIFFWSGPKPLYAKLLARAYETIKKEDPDARVLGCSTSGIDLDFIAQTIDRGGRLDALAIHPYRGVLDDARYMDELRGARARVDVKPTWITEIGFPSQLLGGYSERRQASLVARTYLASLASGAVEKVAWYDFRNDGPDPYYNEQNFGLLRDDFRPKPAYRALATLARTLGDARWTESIDAGRGAYGARFAANDTVDAVAVCAPETGRLLTFETDAEVAVIDAVGEAIAPVRNGNRVTVTLPAGFPVYITGRRGFAFRPVDPVVACTPERSDVRPGDGVEIAFTPKVDAADWLLPFGWAQPRRLAAGVYRLTVPEHAAEQDVELQAIVEHGGRLRVPIALTIVPSRIRI